MSTARTLRPRVDFGTDDHDAGAFTSTPGSNDEVITIYELASDDAGTYATPSYALAHAACVSSSTCASTPS